MKPAITHRLKHLYIYFCIIVITFFSILFGYWYFWPMKVIDVSAVEVSKSIYAPGDQVIYTITYCKYKDIIGIAYRSLVNSTRTTYTEVSGNMTTGCHKINIADLHIPEYTDDGTYHLEATIIYKLNPVREFQISWKSQEFQVKRITSL